MKIRVVGYNEMKDLAAGLADGLLELAEGATVQAALNRLKVSDTDLVLFVNGRAARPDTPLKAGDSLVVFSPIAGG